MRLRVRNFGRKVAFIALCCTVLFIGQWMSAPKQASASSYVPELYQMHTDGSIWRYAGSGLYSWTALDGPDASTVSIAARWMYVYKLHRDGSIWQYVASSNSWAEIDNNAATSAITVSGNGNLYQLHTTGSIWQYNGGGLYSWSELDNNSLTTSIVSGVIISFHFC